MHFLRFLIPAACLVLFVNDIAWTQDREKKKPPCPATLAEIFADTAPKPVVNFDLLRTKPLFKLVRAHGEREIEVFASTLITPRNIPYLFRHTYDQKNLASLGAKGLVVVNFQQERYETLFWQTGEGRHGLNFHHRDALSKANGFLLNNREWQIRFLEIFGLIDQEYWPIPEAAERHQEFIDSVNQVQSHAKAYAENLSRDRNQSSFSEHDLRLSAGFQFTAEKQGETYKIIRMAVDSSIGSAQLSRDMFVKPPVLAQMIYATFMSIHPDLIGFREIEVDLPREIVSELDEVLRPKIGLRIVP